MRSSTIFSRFATSRSIVTAAITTPTSSSARRAQEQHLAAYKNQQAEIQKLKDFAARFGAKASKASQAQSKLKQIDRMDILEAPESAAKTIHIKFPQPTRSGQRVMTLTNVHFAYDTLKVYQGIDLEIEKASAPSSSGPTARANRRC